MQRSLFCCPLSSDVNDVQVFSPLFPNVVSVTSVSGLRVTVERCRIKKKGDGPGRCSNEHPYRNRPCFVFREVDMPAQRSDCGYTCDWS
jgi:hypothetical protein